MSGESLQDKELRFIREERRRLQDRGITDYDDQSAEIAKRWAVIRQFVEDTSANVEDASQPTGFLSVDEPYSDKEANALGLILVDCDMSNTPLVRFIYKLASDVSSDTSSVGAAAAAAAGASASAAFSVRPKIVSGKCEYIDGPYKGRIEGYVYKSGANGVGYYLDGKAPVSHSSCPPIAPSRPKRPRTDEFDAISAHLKLTTLEDMCVDLDYAKSGTKAEKISRIFHAFDGNIVTFLSRLKNETLKDILEDFSKKFGGAHVTYTGNKDELVRRIVQVSQLVS